MANPSNSVVQNLLPVQAYFNLDGSFNTFIGQGVPFYATANPVQSGLTITNSTLNSSPIGNTSPSTGVFTNIATTTGTIATQPVGATDIVNLLALQSYAAGISWKQPCAVATLTNITLSGLQLIDTYTTLPGDRVLVKNQSAQADNGIYLAAAGTWTRALDADIWDELIAAISFIEYGTQKGGAWFCTAQPGGTLGTTPVIFSQFTTSATYSAGTGLTLAGTQFSITNTGVPASTYGSATATPVFAVNAQGQITSVTNTTITPAIGNVTGLGTNVATFLATPTSANLAAAVSDETGSGALVFATSPTLVTPALGTPASGIMTNVTGLPLTTGVTGTLPIGNGGTGQITASAAFNALSPITTAGDLILGTGVNTASRLGIGTNGQVLTSNGTTASWATPSGGVTSFSAGTTGFTPSTATTGVVTLAGTLVAANGGTGQSSYTVGDILYASTTTALSKLAGVATGNALISGGVGAAPSYGKIDLTTTVSGILPGANGGTGNGFFAISGPATSLKTFTFPNASATVLTDNALVTVAQGGTGVGTLTGLVYGNGTSAFTAATAAQVVSVIGTTAVTNATNAVNTGITDDTTTATAVYPTWVTTTTGNLPQKTSSTKLSFVPSTGVLSANGVALTGNTGTVTSVGVTAGTGISVSGSPITTSGSITVTNSGVTSITAGPGMSVSGSTGAVTVSTSGSSGIATVNFIVYTSSTTYTPTSGMKYVIVEGVGGGGGGGGTAGFGGGAGGGGGGYFKMTLTAAQVSSSQTITIGAAGSAGSSGGGTGGSGGTTSFGSYGTGTGGAGGAFSGNNAQSARTAGGTGSSTVTAVLINGQQGGPGGQNQSSVAGPGGDSGLGIGGQGYWGALNQGNAAGLAATGYGGGGGGAENGTNGAANAGGAGTVGAITIQEFI